MQLCFRPLSVIVIFLLGSAVAMAAKPVSPTGVATDWPSFRGSERTGVSLDTGLLQAWPEGGPKLLWDATGAGRGYASLAIAGNRIYTLGDAPSTADGDADEYLLAFDRETGKQIWKTKVGAPWTDGKPTWQSSRSTPTVDGNLVFALTAHGDLICCDAATGKQKWKVNLKSDFGGKKGDGWGYSESVFVDGNQVVCTPGGEETTMIALNKNTGKPLWKTVREGDRGAGHASIVVSTIGKTRVYVQTTAGGALGVRATDGKLLWSYPIDKTTAVIPTPIVRGDLVFFSAGYKRGGALLKQVADKTGGVTVEEIYPLNTQLANKHGGIVLIGDYLYGDSDDQGIIFCADLMTGEQKWKGRGSGRGSAAMAAADGRLYIHFMDGMMVLAKADPAAGTLEETGSFKVTNAEERPSWAHPVVVDGKLYLREQDHILCYDVRAK